jgi:SAM-dependent methyltransferase
MATGDADYLLGTHDAEVERLGVQHRVWRPFVLGAWEQAGFTVGQTLIDLGCGPGYATIDLAEIVGPRGRVIAVDRSRRFLDVLRTTAAARGLHNIDIIEQDLDAVRLDGIGADGAWCRWVLAFVRQPEALIRAIHAALRPGAVFTSYEYFDYGAWRVTPESPELEEFVDLVIRSWRDSGGEPDIGLALPRMLEANGFEVLEERPLIHLIRPAGFMWHWPAVFIRSGVERFEQLGHLSAERAAAIVEAFTRAEQTPGVRMITPGVLQVSARRL